MEKKLLLVFAFIVIQYASVWIFNHINAWAGIALSFITAYLAVKYIINKLKSN